MAGATAPFVLRMSSQGIEDVLAPLRAIAPTSADAQKALDTLGAAAARSGKNLDDLKGSAEGATGGAAKGERDLQRMGAALDRLAAAADPAVDALQKAERAERLLADAQAKGVSVTDAQRAGVEALRAAADKLAYATSAAGQAEIKAASDAKAAADAHARSAVALGGLLTAHDKVAASAANLAKAEAVVQDAMARGVPVGEAHLRILAQMRAGHEALELASTQSGAANDNAGGKMQRLGQVAGQAGFQIQDFAVQVAGGQSALVALGQQGSQLLGVFGPAGATAGAALAVGVLVAQFLAGEDAAKRFDAALDEQEKAYKATEDAAQRRRTGLADEAEKVANLITYYAGLTEEQRRGEMAVLRLQQARLEQTGREQSGAIGTTIRDRVTNPTYGIAPGDLIGDGGVSSLQAVPAGVQQAADALAKLDDASNRSREGIRAIIGELDAAVQSGGSFRSAITAARDEVIRLAPELERNGEAVKQVREQIEAAGGPLAGLGQGASRSAGQVDALSGSLGEAVRRIQELRRAATDNPFVDLDRKLANLQAQSQALARGDNDAADAIERREQARSQAAEQRAKMLDDIEKAARETGATEQEVATSRLAAEQRIAQQQASIFRQEEANRDQRKRNDEAEAASKRAAAAASRDARASQASAARDARDDDALATKILGAKADAEYRYAQFAADARQALDRRLITEEQYREALERNNPLTIEAGRILDQIRTPAEKYAEQLERMKALLEAGKLNQEQFNRAVAQFNPDTKALEEAGKKQEEAVKRQQQAVEQANRQVTDSIVRYSADTFADLFDKNGKGWKGMLDTFETTFRKTMLRLAAEAIIRPIVSPIVQGLNLGSVYGSGLAVSGGYTGGGGVTPATDSSGNLLNGQQISNYGSVIKQAGGLFDSKGFTLGSNDWQSGIIGKFDNLAQTNIGGFLNTTAYTVGGDAQLASQLGAYQNTGMTVGGIGSTTSGVPVSVGNAAVGAAGIVGGAYGIYQGVQTGGAKGWAQGVSGAAGVAGGAAMLAGGSAAGGVIAGIATVAPYVAIAALIASYFLSGAKPSNFEGNAKIDLATGGIDIGGQEGKKYSQENRDTAVGIAEAIRTYTQNLTDTLGVKSTAVFQVGVGNRDGLYLQAGRERTSYGNDENGTKELLKEVSRIIVEGSADQLKGSLATTYKKLGTGDMDKLLEGLQWTKDTYQVFEKAQDPTKLSSYQQSLDAIVDAYKPIIEKAKEYGLALKPIADAQDKQTKALDKQRTDAFNDNILSMKVQTAQLTGGNLTSTMLGQFDKQTKAEWEAQVASIWDAGFNQKQVDQAWSVFTPLKALQRTALERQYTRAWEDQASNATALRSGVEVDYLKATGKDTAADVFSYEEQRRVAAINLKRQMEDLGFSVTEAASILAKFGDTTAATSAKMWDAANDSARGTAAGTVSSLADYARSLKYGDGTTSDARTLYESAQREFQAVLGAAETGDWSSITKLQGYADTLLSTSRTVNGSGTGYASDYGRVQQALASIAGMGADQLTASVLQVETRTQTQVLEAAIKSLGDQLGSVMTAVVQQRDKPNIAQGIAA